MATLVIKNVPDDLHAKLKQQAQNHRRSLAKEALTLLEQAIIGGPTPSTSRHPPKPVRLNGGPLTIDEIEKAILSGRE